jgi:multidrug efflux pump subunit AcrA (membrane-fusion protein)
MKRWIEPAGGAMSKSFSNDILECRKSTPATLKAVLLKTGLLSVVLVTLCLFLPAAYTPARAQSNDSQPQAGAPAEEVLTPFPDIVLQGKLQCFLRRQVVMPYRGVITSLDLRSGQTVKKGQVLARYKLAADVVQQLQSQLAAPQIKDMELALANQDKTLVPLEAKRAETESLVKDNMAPSQSLVQIEKEIQLQKQSRKAAEERLKLERQLLVEFKAYVKDLLGGSLNPLAGSQDASITAPISGQVVSIQSDLYEGLELGAGSPAFIIGVMDPMVIHAEIHESDIVNVHLGDRAEVTMESVANRTFEATVNRFSLTPLAPGVLDPSYYDIEFTIPNSDYVLKEGFKGEIVCQPLMTAGSSLPKIVNPFGLEKIGGQPFFWMGGRRETEIWITSPKNGKVVITGYFQAGDGPPGNPRRRFLLSSQNCRERQLVLPKDGWCRITVPVSAGPNRISLRALDERTPTQVSQKGDTGLIGVRGLAVSAVN